MVTTCLEGFTFLAMTAAQAGGEGLGVGIGLRSCTCRGGGADISSDCAANYTFWTEHRMFAKSYVQPDVQGPGAYFGGSAACVARVKLAVTYFGGSATSVEAPHTVCLLDEG